MPTCRNIITAAFRKGRVYGPGEDPTSEDMSDGLDELQSLYETWGSNGMFGRLTDTLQSGDYEAEPFQRIQISDGTVTLPTEQPDDDEAPPFAMSFIEVIDTTNETVARYLYENGEWIDIAALALDDEAPLAGRGKMGLAACLTMQMDSWNAEILPSTMRQAASFKTGLSLKLGSSAQRTGPDWF